MQILRLPILAGLAFLVVCGPAQAGSSPPVILAHLEEESIPAADLTVTPTPTPTPTPEAGSSESPTPTESPSETPTPSPTPSPEPTSAEIFPEPTPLPTSGDELPPLEAGTVTPSLRISDSTLQSAIDQEQNPARAESMRTAEQARVDLVNGHPDEAIRELGRAVSIDPSDPYAYFYLGRSYIAKQNYPQAMTFLKRAEIGFGSGNSVWLSETLAFEALAYEESGHTVAAAAAYQQALQVNPGNLMARVGYTRLSPDLTPATPVAPEAAPSTDANSPPPEAGAPPPPPAEAPPPPPPNESTAPTN